LVRWGGLGPGGAGPRADCPAGRDAAAGRTALRTRRPAARVPQPRAGAACHGPRRRPWSVWPCGGVRSTCPRTRSCDSCGGRSPPSPPPRPRPRCRCRRDLSCPRCRGVDAVGLVDAFNLRP
jgi:hypothetical protein